MQSNKKKRFEIREESISVTGIFEQDRTSGAFGYLEVNRPEPLAPETLNLLRENRKRNLTKTIFTLVLIAGLKTMTVPFFIH